MAKKKEKDMMTGDYKPVDLLDDKSIKGVLKRIKVMKNPHLCLDVTMHLRNGEKTQFVAMMEPDKNCFYYQGGTYIVIDEALKYNLATKMYSGIWHQDISLPLKQDVPVTEIKRKIEEVGVADIDNAIDPVSLRRFMESNIIQNAMRGVEMVKLLNFIKLLVIIILILCSIFTIKYLGDSGFFKGIPLIGRLA